MQTLMITLLVCLLSSCGNMPPVDRSSPTGCPWYQFVTDTQKQGFTKHQRLTCKNTITATWDIYTYPGGAVLYYESNATLVRVENGPMCVAQMFNTTVPGSDYTPDQCLPVVTL